MCMYLYVHVSVINFCFQDAKPPMRKKLATVTAHRELTVSLPWAHGDQNGHSQPWLSRDLGRDWAVT